MIRQTFDVCASNRPIINRRSGLSRDLLSCSPMAELQPSSVFVLSETIHAVVIKLTHIQVCHTNNL